MINVTAARALVNTRVRVCVEPVVGVLEWHVGILRGAPSEASVWLAVDAQGHEVKLEDVTHVEPALLTCEECTRQVSFLQDERCTDCRRGEAERQRALPFVARCQVCGAGGAFRNPRDPEGRILCPEDHAKTGLPLAVSSGDAARLRADCLTADINDPRHRWKGVRGTRWACTRCGGQRYTPPPHVSDLTPL